MSTSTKRSAGDDLLQSEGKKGGGSTRMTTTVCEKGGLVIMGIACESCPLRPFVKSREDCQRNIPFSREEAVALFGAITRIVYEEFLARHEAEVSPPERDVLFIEGLGILCLAEPKKYALRFPSETCRFPSW